MSMFIFREQDETKRFNRMGKTVASCNTLAGGMGSSGQSMYSGGGVFGPGSNRFSPVFDRLEEPSIVDEWLSRDIRQINRMFRYLYLRDNVAGPTVEMMATIPWSPYHLTGLEDHKDSAYIFEESMENFDVLTTMPEISTEYLVIGRNCLTCIYDPSKGIFKTFIPQDPDYLEITPIPMKGYDPKIDVIADQNIRKFLMSKDERDLRAMNTIPESLIKKFIRGGKVPLEPLNTIFSFRKTFTSDWVGTSIYTRLLPFWALDKALWNSTLITARRRTRPITHITAGIDDKWEPEDYELDDITNLFMQADEDPSGAIVVTRNGIQVQDVKDPTSWKISDEGDYLSRGKMIAMGINEEILTGNMTFNNLDTALSFFMEKIKNFRNQLTNQVFHRKMFPVLARANGLYKKTSASPQVIHKKQLIIPEIKWHKDLRPKGDAEYLTMLRDLKDMGVPINLAILAAAGDFDIDKLISDTGKDLEFRKKLKTYRDEVKKLEGGDMGMEGGGEGGEASMSSFLEDMKIWDKKGTFLGVTRKDIKNTVADFVKCRNLQEVVSSTTEVNKIISPHFDGNTLKISAMKYLLSRWGLLNKSVLDKNYTSDMIGHIAEANTEGNEFDEISFSKEINILGNYMTNQPKLSKNKAEKLAVLVAKLRQKEQVKSADLNIFGGLERK